MCHLNLNFSTSQLLQKMQNNNKNKSMPMKVEKYQRCMKK